MAGINKVPTTILTLVLFVLTIGHTYGAGNKVVVIPMAGDQIAADKAQWALVKGVDGSIIRQSGGITATGTGDGGYFVDFGRDVTGHAIVANSQWLAARVITVIICGNADGLGEPGETITCPPSYDTTSHVFVSTHDPVTGTNKTGHFYIAALP